MPFEIVAPYEPRGDQPKAIEDLSAGLRSDPRWQCLLGVTGSGKTFTMAHVIARYQRPTLVISHNKTLAAQLYSEFKEFFPGSEVHYFVSYYDYYQPEAYIPAKDIYIEKDADINEDIDRLRLAATSALMSRQDVIIVASVSCIYGLGSPEHYRGMLLEVRQGEPISRDRILSKMTEIQYERNEVAFVRGKFRARGDVIEVHPSYQETAIRIQLDGDVVERIVEFHPVSGRNLRELPMFHLFPAKHYVMPQEAINHALEGIESELAARISELKVQGKLLEAQRLQARTNYDLELLREVGYCKGIENYSRHLSGRAPGQRPYTLIDFFPKDFLCIVDESHVTLPQIHGMFNGDHARKSVLVEHGFRLPSAMDNRPMRFEEWEKCLGHTICVSATPDAFEIKRSAGRVVEQIIRPTGLIDPEIQVRPARGQVEDLVREIRERAARNERALVTTLTKRLAEDLATYLEEEGIKGRYIHSEVQTIERVELLRDLREGKFDALVGVNLLREGLDLPEVSLVAILDADKEGFLRSETSIIQTVGRTARNVNGRVILYADSVTPSMRRAIEETDRRRRRQVAYNDEHGVTPKSIEKAIRKGIEEIVRSERTAAAAAGLDDDEFKRTELVQQLEREMLEAAEALEFERAADLRDRIAELQGGPASKRAGGSGARSGRGRRKR